MTEGKKITTIKLQTETKNRLDRLKEHDKESYEEALKKILYILNTLRKKPELAQKILVNIDRSIKRKQRYTLDSPKKSQEKQQAPQSKPRPKPTSGPKQNPQSSEGSH